MSTTSTAIFSNPLFATYSVYARNASIAIHPVYNCSKKILENLLNRFSGDPDDTGYWILEFLTEFYLCRTGICVTFHKWWMQFNVLLWLALADVSHGVAIPTNPTDIHFKNLYRSRYSEYQKYQIWLL